MFRGEGLVPREEANGADKGGDVVGAKDVVDSLATKFKGRSLEAFVGERVMKLGGGTKGTEVGVGVVGVCIHADDDQVVVIMKSVDFS